MWQHAAIWLLMANTGLQAGIKYLLEGYYGFKS